MNKYLNTRNTSLEDSVMRVLQGLSERVEYVEYDFKNRSDAMKAKRMLDGVQLMNFDINDDGILNVLDVIVYLQDILNGTTTQAMNYLQSVLTTEEFEKLTEEFYYIGDKFLFAWPNPSNEYMHIAGNGIVNIYDMMGREVKQIYIDGTYRWNTSNLPTGIYYIANGFERIQVTLVK